MPNFFLDVHDHRGHHPDEIGQDLPDLNAVRTEAVRSLRDLAAMMAADADRQSIVVTARDGDRNIVYSATLDFTGEWLAEPKRAA